VLPLQQAAQLRAPIRPTVAVAIEHEQIAFLQIDSWQRAGVLVPPQRNGIGIG
jgi:hypothetical protein